MHEIGLHPSTTGEPCGKETGQSCSHYIIEGGAFARAYEGLAKNGMAALYVELWDDEAARKTRKAKAASKTKYTCPTCQMNAWAKPDTRLICGDCEILMLAEVRDNEEN